MLTKLQDLKDKKNCVFVVATNYFEKIDSAIRRRGRMDEYFLLTLPNCKQRLHLLYRFLTGELGEDSKVGKAGEEEFAEAARKVPASKKTKTEGERSLGQGTVFFSYNDLKYVVDLLDLASPSPALSKDTTVEDVVTALASKVPEVDIPVSLTSYEKRLDDEAFEEFFLLVYLLAEVEREPTRPEAAVISKAINEIGESDFEDFLKNLLKDDHIVSELESWRDKWQLHG
jgi:SpoVK/Ycf46/Vps4 family AAA+-type ATPase